MTTTASPRHIENTEVAKLVRKDLRATFGKGVKFSVRTDKYAGGSSIRVSWTDGPTENEVESLIGHYKGATFDGMTDMKDYHDTLVVGENGPEVVSYGNDFIFTSRTLSDEGVDRIITKIAEDNPWRTFGPEFRDESIDAEADKYAPLDDRSLMNGYLHRGWDVIRQYANQTAL